MSIYLTAGHHCEHNVSSTGNSLTWRRPMKTICPLLVPWMPERPLAASPHNMHSEALRHRLFFEDLPTLGWIGFCKNGYQELFCFIFFYLVLPFDYQNESNFLVVESCQSGFMAERSSLIGSQAPFQQLKPQPYEATYRRRHLRCQQVLNNSRFFRKSFIYCHNAKQSQKC